MFVKGVQKDKNTFFLFVSIFLISSTIISLQLLMQRFLSVVLSYHYVFIVVSIALFGISLGGFIGYLTNDYLKKYYPITVLLFAAFLFYFFVSSTFIFATHAYNAHTIRLNIFVFSGIFIFPFIAGGFYTAKLFYSFPEMSGQLYGTDLTGAAFGCIGIIYLLNTLDLGHALFAVCAPPLALLSVWAFRHLARDAKRSHLLGFGVLAGCAIIAGVQLLNVPEISSGQNPRKEIYDALHTFNGQILESKDSAQGRVDLIKFAEYPELMDIYVDGTAGMPMYRFNGSFADPNPEVVSLQREFPGYFPLAHIEDHAKEDALIIGPGGGRDILLARMAGFQHITVVEVNPEIVNIVNKYASFNGDIFNQPGIDLHTGEGRSFLRSDKQKYDLILFSLPVTNTSQGLGSFALTENYLYTTEAIGEYLDHLRDDGYLVLITHNDLEVLRLLTITLSSFREKKLSNAEAMKHLYVLGSEDYPVLVVGKQKINKNNSKATLKAAFNQPWFIPGSSYFPQTGFPFLNGMLLSIEGGRATADDLIGEGEKRGYDLSPVTDQSPFFYKLENALPASLMNVFYFSIGILAVFLVLPFSYYMWKINKSSSSDRSEMKRYFVFSTYFAMIGTGFMILEVALIHKFMLILGNPIYSMSTMIFTMLVGAGIGSLTSSSFDSHSLRKNLIVICGALVCLILLYQVSLPAIFRTIGTGSIVFRTVVSVVIVFPLGFAMGFPFPMAIRLIKSFRMAGIIPWMLAINGASSVFGSALTVVLVMAYGYDKAFFTAAFCYGTVFLSLCLISKEDRHYCLG